MIKKNLAQYIDHTALKSTTTKVGIEKLCNEAKKYNFMSVCINPCFVELCKKLLNGTQVKVCTVIGFPLGCNKSETKAFEAQKAIEDGAVELDMVINVGKIKDEDWDYVENDIKRVVEVASNKAIVKVILETCLLTNEEKVKACEIVKKAGANFVKTSTGFSTSGATVEDIKLMRKTVGENFGVKASGGIRDYGKAMEMINAGATRIGASAGIAIVKNAKVEGEGY